MVKKSDSIRKTIFFNEHTWAKLEELVRTHGGWKYRRNTIVQAAIVALAEMPLEEQKRILSEVHRQDGRWVYNSKHIHGK